MGASSLTTCTLIIRDDAGRSVGRLTISLLPGDRPEHVPSPLTTIVSTEPIDSATSVAVQLMEGNEYLYEIQLDGEADSVRTSKPEMFQPDNSDGRRGRLRPGLYVGTVSVAILSGSVSVGRTSFEVRSQKLNYISQYRWMLGDLAEAFTEVIMQRFAPSQQAFSPDPTQDAATLYQRFAFLQQLLTSPQFVAAIGRILANPHRSWVAEDEYVPAGRHVPASSRVARQIASSGPKVQWSNPAWPYGFLPRSFVVSRTDDMVDTPENRFVKFALKQWYGTIRSLLDCLRKSDSGPTLERALRESWALLDYLDGIFGSELMREVGDLQAFPSSSQVLQHREGYREVLHAYLQFEVAAKLAWRGGDDVYGAGQKDVATLYEYWVYLKLAQVISRLCAKPLDFKSLFEVTDGGLSVGLHRGRQSVLSGIVERHGRRMRLEFWYNKTFAANGGNPSSWTRQMRPDYSLLIRPEPGTPHFDEVWVHFDAKYRVERLQQLFGEPDSDGEDAEQTQVSLLGAAKRDDLLKMHAYRDAIRRSVGAYVIYPGSSTETHRLYHEILPGLGAFTLSPSEQGDAAGAASISRFIRDVIDHVALQSTQHERSRYWARAIHEDAPTYSAAQAVPFLRKPPADTTVVLGFVKSEEHLTWIHQAQRYNLRADERRGQVGLNARELAADLVVLYGSFMDGVQVWRVDGVPEVVTASQLRASGYPNPRGELYFCLPLAKIQDSMGALSSLTTERVRRFRDSMGDQAVHGAPVAVTWADIAQILSDSADPAEEPRHA